MIVNEPEVDYGHAPLRRAERMAALLELLTADRTLAVAEVAQRFGVSASTLRRDLQLLQEQKLLERTHGGAVATRAEHELPVRYRTNQQREQKVAIAKIAVARVPLGAVVGLTGGTTTSEVARQLAVRDQLTVVTNALNIAADMPHAAGKAEHRIVDMVAVGARARIAVETRREDLVGKRRSHEELG